MLRALSLALLLSVSALSALPAPARAEDEAVLAQQNQSAPPQAAPKRDCERNQDGVS